MASLKVIGIKLIKLAIFKVLPVIAVAALVYCAIAYFNGLFPFGGGDGEGIGVSLIDPKYVVDHESVSEPPSLVIEIHENRIIYNGEEISLDELEIIIAKYSGDEYGWTILDVYRADKDTFDKVKELLANNNIFFAEE